MATDIENLVVDYSRKKPKPPVTNDFNLRFTAELYNLIVNSRQNTYKNKSLKLLGQYISKVYSIQMHIEPISYNEAIGLTRKKFRTEMKNLNRHIKAGQKYNFPKKSDMYACYMILVQQPNNAVKYNETFKKMLVKTLSKSSSGIVVITSFTAPGKMISPNGDASCPKNCSFCPSFPGQPKSYDPDEPAAQRAARNNFDPILQMFDRLESLENRGHSIEKIQYEISGGTFCYYPKKYIREFMRLSFYAANIYSSSSNIYQQWLIQANHHKFRKVGTLEEEQILNESSKHKIIGITIETRPDSISERELKQLREFGVTRVQLGIQHTDNDVLNKNNREDSIESADAAIELLKKNGFKVTYSIIRPSIY